MRTEGVRGVQGFRGVLGALGGLLEGGLLFRFGVSFWGGGGGEEGGVQFLCSWGRAVVSSYAFRGVVLSPKDWAGGGGGDGRGAYELQRMVVP